MSTMEKKSYMIGEIEIPRKSPHFMSCRNSIRAAIVDKGIDNVVIGISGGADSLAMTAACLAEGVKVHAVSINHNLQEGSYGVSVNAIRQAMSMGATGEIVNVHVPSGGSMEANARNVRYDAIRTVANGRKILIGHTMDDNAETFILGAMRANLTGLNSYNDDIVRPLLNVRRKDTLKACEELGLDYWSDPQNEDTKYRRVAVRKQILPMISDVNNGDAIPSIAITAHNAQEDNDLLNSMAMTMATDDCNSLYHMHPAIRRRIIVNMIHDKGISPSVDMINRINDLVIRWNGQKPFAVNNMMVYRKNGKIVIE